MSDLSPNVIPAETPAPKYLSGLRTVLRDVMSRPSGAIGLSLVVFHVLLALTSPLYVPYDFKTMNSMLMLMPPSSEHWLGTDHLGRDVLTRVLLGGREALLVTGVATPIAVVLDVAGVLIAVVSGVWGVPAHAGLGFDDRRCAGLYVICPLGRAGPGDRPVVADYWHQSDGGCAGKSAGH